MRLKSIFLSRNLTRRGACFPGVTKGAVEWFPLEQRVLAIGIAHGGSGAQGRTGV